MKSTFLTTLFALIVISLKAQVSGYLGKKNSVLFNLNFSPNFQSITLPDTPNETTFSPAYVNLDFRYNRTITRRMGLEVEYKQQDLYIFGSEVSYSRYFDTPSGWNKTYATFTGMTDMTADARFGFLNVSFSTKENIQQIGGFFKIGFGFVQVDNVSNYFGELTYHEPTTADIPEIYSIAAKKKYNSLVFKWEIGKSWRLTNFMFLNASCENYWIAGLINSYELNVYDFPLVGIVPNNHGNVYRRDQSFSSLGIDGDLHRHGVKQALSRQNLLNLNIGLSFLF